MIQLICGNEPYLILKKKQNIISSVAMPELDLYRSCTIDEDEVTFATSVSWSGNRKILLLEVKSLAELDNKFFSQLWDNPPQECDIYIFSDKVEQNRKEYKRFQSANAVGYYNKLDNKRFPEFVKRYLDGVGKKMDGAAFLSFCEMLNYFNNDGVTLFDVVNSLETLVCVTEGEMISSELVKQFVAPHEVENCFSLAGHIKKRDLESALHEIELMKSKNDLSVVKLISILLREVRIAYKAKLYPKEMKKSTWNNNFLGLDSALLKNYLVLLTQSLRDVKSGKAGSDDMRLLLARMITMLDAE